MIPAVAEVDALVTKYLLKRFQCTEQTRVIDCTDSSTKTPPLPPGVQQTKIPMMQIDLDVTYFTGEIQPIQVYAGYNQERDTLAINFYYRRIDPEFLKRTQEKTVNESE